LNEAFKELIIKRKSCPKRSKLTCIAIHWNLSSFFKKYIVTTWTLIIFYIIFIGLIQIKDLRRFSMKSCSLEIRRNNHQILFLIFLCSFGMWGLTYISLWLASYILQVILFCLHLLFLFKLCKHLKGIEFNIFLFNLILMRLIGASKLTVGIRRFFIYHLYVKFNI